MIETVAAGPQWQRLATVPVRAIISVSKNGVPLPLTAYSLDVDSNGAGWVRILDPAVRGNVEIAVTAGIASDRNGVPEPIRQGVLRLAAHLFASRDGDSAGVPAAVTALWRPYRRMQLS